MDEELENQLNELNSLIDVLLDEVSALRTPDNIGTPLRADLDQAQIDLEHLKGKIFVAQLENYADAIKQDAQKLKQIADEIKEKADNLDGLSDKIKSAASIAGTVADLASGLV